MDRAIANCQETKLWTERLLLGNQYPQGSVLGPVLVLVYIDDLEEGVTGNILKFADDTKLLRKTKEIGDKQKLQDDIDKLVRWSEKWLTHSLIWRPSRSADTPPMAYVITFWEM